MRNQQRSTVRIKRSHSVLRDPRFVTGIVLIALSIAAVIGIVHQARAGETLYQATRDIAEGEALSPENLQTVEAHTGTQGVYLPASQALEGQRALRSIHKGELLAESMASNQEQKNSRTYIVSVADGLPEDTRVGSELELWFVPAPRIGEEEQVRAVQMKERAILVRVLGNTGRIGANAGTRIEIRTTSDGIAQILSASHDNGTLAAVPVGKR